LDRNGANDQLGSVLWLLQLWPNIQRFDQARQVRCLSSIEMKLPTHPTEHGSVIDLVTYVYSCGRRRAQGILSTLQELDSEFRKEIRLLNVNGRPRRCASASTLAKIVDWLLPEGDVHLKQHRSKTLAYLSGRLLGGGEVDCHNAGSLTHRPTELSNDKQAQEANLESNEYEIHTALEVVETAIRDLTETDSLLVDVPTEPVSQRILQRKPRMIGGPAQRGWRGGGRGGRRVRWSSRGVPYFS
jgi:hypothetical protein